VEPPKVIGKRFKITSIVTTAYGVALTLSPLEKPPEQVMEPIPRSETERVVMTMQSVMERTLKKFLPPEARTSYPSITVELTEEEYAQLGKPTIGDLIELTLKVSG
jgi:hypothetical protein